MAIHSHFPANSASYLATGNRFAGTGDPRAKKSNLICSHCKKPGHTVDKCYRIIGFPSDFKFTKSKKIPGNVRSNIIVGSGEGTNDIGLENNSQLNQLSKEQFSNSFNCFIKLKLVKMNCSFRCQCQFCW